VLRHSAHKLQLATAKLLGFAAMAALGVWALQGEDMSWLLPPDCTIEGGSGVLCGHLDVWRDFAAKAEAAHRIAAPWIRHATVILSYCSGEQLGMCRHMASGVAACHTYSDGVSMLQ
jgi:hypothetical protein